MEDKKHSDPTVSYFRRIGRSDMAKTCAALYNLYLGGWMPEI